MMKFRRDCRIGDIAIANPYLGPNGAHHKLLQVILQRSSRQQQSPWCGDLHEMFVALALEILQHVAFVENACLIDRSIAHQ